MIRFNKMEYSRPVGFELLMSGLQFDAYFVNKVVKVHDFMPDLKVHRFMPDSMLVKCAKVVKAHDFLPDLKVNRFISIVNFSVLNKERNH